MIIFSGASAQNKHNPQTTVNIPNDYPQQNPKKTKTVLKG